MVQSGDHQYLHLPFSRFLEMLANVLCYFQFSVQVVVVAVTWSLNVRSISNVAIRAAMPSTCYSKTPCNTCARSISPNESSDIEEKSAVQKKLFVPRMEKNQVLDTRRWMDRMENLVF